MKKNNIKKVAVLSLVGVMGLTMFSGCGKKITMHQPERL